MEVSNLSHLVLAVMFSPPGIANFIICTLLKKRVQASVAAVIAASAFMFLNQAALSQQPLGDYTISAILAVIAMMIASHLGFTVGEKVIRANRKND